MEELNKIFCDIEKAINIASDIANNFFELDETDTDEQKYILHNMSHTRIMFDVLHDYIHTVKKDVEKLIKKEGRK